MDSYLSYVKDSVPKVMSTLPDVNPICRKEYRVESRRTHIKFVGGTYRFPYVIPICLDVTAKIRKDYG